MRITERRGAEYHQSADRHADEIAREICFEQIAVMAP
jgi:hypothetical protein